MSERDVAQNLQDTLAGSIQTAPTFWLNPKNGVSYPIVAQTPQYWERFALEPGERSRVYGSNKQILGGVATIKRGVSDAVVSHYAVQPVIDIFATNNERDLGAVSADIQRILDATAKDAPPGSTIVLRGQTQTMSYAYQQLFVGIALAVVLIYLLIVVNFQSWLDPVRHRQRVADRPWPASSGSCSSRAPPCRFPPSPERSCAWAWRPPTAFSSSVSRASGWRRAPTPSRPRSTRASRAFGPVLMTALAMIIGMAPMALSAELNAPLGRAVIGGLICATVATLFFVPAVFRLVHERKPSRASKPASNLHIEAKPI